MQRAVTDRTIEIRCESPVNRERGTVFPHHAEDIVYHVLRRRFVTDIPIRVVPQPLVIYEVYLLTCPCVASTKTCNQLAFVAYERVEILQRGHVHNVWTETQIRQR